MQKALRPTLMFFVNSRADNRRKSGGFEKLVAGPTPSLNFVVYANVSRNEIPQRESLGCSKESSLGLRFPYFFINERTQKGRISTHTKNIHTNNVGVWGIFGDRRGRRGAELKVMAAVEGKKEGYYTGLAHNPRRPSSLPVIV